MIDKAEMALIRHRISDGIKGDMTMLDHRCTECDVGINKGEETFVISPHHINILCKVCKEEILPE